MQVLVDSQGKRIQVYRPYINREEEGRNVSIFVPESSTNTGLYFTEQVNHLTGNSEPGTFVQEAQGANFWWNMTPTSKLIPKKIVASSFGNSVYTNPQNTFLRQNYLIPNYRNMDRVYGNGQTHGLASDGLGMNGY